MPFKVSCPGCRKALQVPDEVAGKRAKCPACGQAFVVPRPPAASAPAESKTSWFDEAMNDPFPAAAKPAANPDRQDAASQPPDAVGAWRDGKQLVVAVRGCASPRCVKTGAPTSGRTTALELVWAPQAALWFIAFGAIGHLIAKRMTGTKVLLDVPITSDWLKRRRKLRWLGWSLVVAGLLWVVLTAVVWIAAEAVMLNSPRGRAVGGMDVAPYAFRPSVLDRCDGVSVCPMRFHSDRPQGRGRLCLGCRRYPKFLEQLPTWDR